MREWIIKLSGKAADLERLVGLRNDDAGWHVERDDRRGVVLHSSQLDALEDRSEVRRAATNLISLIDDSARTTVHRFDGVALADCVLIVDGQEQFVAGIIGSVGRQVLQAITQKGYGAGVGPPSAPDGTPPSPREYEKWEMLRRFKLLAAHPDLAAALRYMKEEPGMAGYYKTAEAIKYAVHGNWDTLVSLGWTTKRELTRFRLSAQPKRHHRGQVPAKPLNEAQASTYVRGLLDKLIKHLNSTGP